MRNRKKRPMGVTIKKVVLHNFKKFKDFSADFRDGKNIIVGENESGKSTLLTAIDLTLSASFAKVEHIGFENLFNTDSIEHFKKLSKGERCFSKLPILSVDIYLKGLERHEFDGYTNHKRDSDCGIRLEITPDSEYAEIINNILLASDVFPFEYYKVSYRTFSAKPYDKYHKILSNILIDNSEINGEYAKREYIKGIYYDRISEVDRIRLQHSFRDKNEEFSARNLIYDSSSEIPSFKIPSINKYSLENQIQIYHGNINIDNKGKGIQNLIKTRFALKKTQDHQNKIILIEEPENHLSALNMQKLISEVYNYSNGQMFITTHNNMIASRLGLENLLILSKAALSTKLSGLTPDTSKFFIKAPNNNILNFVLSHKVILVEGHAEYILMERFISDLLEADKVNDIQIISVNGISFKRYLEVANLLQIRTVVITDNDGDYEKNCNKKYRDYNNIKYIKIFAPTDNSLSTFEKAIYAANKELCLTLFGKGEDCTLTYMLSNKTECAYKLLKDEGVIVIPEYIKEAIKWIND